jgi:hypothetical protein
MKGVIVHVNEEKRPQSSPVRRGLHGGGFQEARRIHSGDQVDQGLWFGEHGKWQIDSNHQVEVEVQCIVRDLATAERECDEV